MGGANRRGIEPQGAIDEHDDAELLGAHAHLLTDGQEDGRTNQNRGRHVQEGAQHEQDDVHTQEYDPWGRADAGQHFPCQLSHAIEANQITKHRADANQQQHGTGTFNGLGCGFHLPDWVLDVLRLCKERSSEFLSYDGLNSTVCLVEKCTFYVLK